MTNSFNNASFRDLYRISVRMVSRGVIRFLFTMQVGLQLKSALFLLNRSLRISAPNPKKSTGFCLLELVNGPLLLYAHI